MNDRYHEKIAKEKGKLCLRESALIVDFAKDSIICEKLNENTLIDSKKAKQIEARAVLRNIPVTRYERNANGRVYNRKLWENVQKSGLFEGSDCYADHAEEDYKILDSIGVWHNFRVLEDCCVADLYLIGEGGYLLYEKAKAFGRIGYSTVGYGQLEEGDIVDPDSYEYANCDAVTSPSQGTYATNENLVEPEIKQESIIKIEKNDSILKEGFTNNKVDSVAIQNEHILKQENNTLKGEEVIIMDKIQEANFKNHVNAKIKEAKKNENISDAIDDLKTLIIPDDMVQIREKVESSISELQAKLEEKKVNAENSLSEKTKEFDGLKVKYNAACKSLEELTGRYKKVKAIAEKKIEAVKAEGKHVRLFNESKSINDDIKQLCEDRKGMIKDLKHFIENTKNMKADIKVLTDKLKIAEKRIKIYEDELEAAGYDFDDEENKPVEPVIESEDDDADDMGGVDTDAGSDDDSAEGAGDLDDLGSDEEVEINEEDEMEEPVAEPTGDEEVMMDDDAGEEMPSEDEPYEFSFDEEEGDMVADDTAPEVSDEEILPEEDEEMPMANDAGGEGYMGGEGEEVLPEEDEMPDMNDEEILPEEDEEIVDDEVDGEKLPEATAKEVTEFFSKAKTKGISQSGKQAESKKIAGTIKEKMLKEEINKYLVQEIKKNPALKDAEKEIMKSTSLMEAVNKVTSFKSKKSNKAKSPVSLKESMMIEKPDWLGDRD